MSVIVTIDGERVEAQEGALLIDVCREVGIDIPHFCYHPGLGPDGNCRMCQVEFVSERGNRLAISCKATVTEGMEVLTQSEPARRARASVEEMLLLNHPLDCPICDKSGECTLQNYYMEHDLQDSRQTFTRFKKNKAIDIGPTLVLDQERCVLCDRCVRFLRDVAGDEQLFIAGRAHGAYLTTFPGHEVTSPYSINTVDLCPVGALTAKDFRFTTPSWCLKKTPSVCITCARGCSMEINTNKDEVRRIRPRHNPDVNGYWACDEGRLNYKFVNENRVKRSRLRTGAGVVDISVDEALASVRSMLGLNDGADKPAVVVLASATCTLEEMYLLKRLNAEHLQGSMFVARHVSDGVGDDILRKEDKHPNTKGAELMGLGVLCVNGEPGEPGEDSAKITAALGENGVLLAAGFNTDISPSLEAIAQHARKVIAIAGCENALTEAAELVVRGLTFAEKDGLVVNFAGHIQRLKPAILRNYDMEWVLWDRLLAQLAGKEETEFISQLRKTISECEPAFAGISLADVGPLGVRVEEQPVS